MTSGNLGKCFDASRRADVTALIEPFDFDSPRYTTYGELDAECDAIARGLVARGFKRGDAIGILGRNSRELLCAYFGTMRAGMIAVPFSYKLPDDIIAHIVADADLKAVFHDADFGAKCPGGPALLSLDPDRGYRDLLDFGPFETVEPEAREIAMILYTSGSTGKPKGVLLSHDSQRWSLERGALLYGDRDTHRYLVAAPMFHMNATISVKSALFSGASVVLLPTFDAMAYARAIDAFGVTWLTSVPTMLAMVAREAGRMGGLDFSSVTHVTMGSAPLTQSLINKV